MWRMFLYIVYFLVRRFHWFLLGRTVYACVHVWTASFAQLPPHAHHITPSVVSESMSGADSGFAATTSEAAGSAASSVTSASARPKEKRSSLPAFPFVFSVVVCVRCSIPRVCRFFFFLPEDVVCMRLLHRYVIKKRSSLPAFETRTYATAIAKYRHCSCHLFPTRASLPKSEILSTVKKWPSCCITAELSQAYFGFTLSVKAATIRYLNTVYRRKITVVSYYHRTNFQHIFVSRFPSTLLPWNYEISTTVSKTSGKWQYRPAWNRLKYRHQRPPCKTCIENLVWRSGCTRSWKYDINIRTSAKCLPS